MRVFAYYSTNKNKGSESVNKPAGANMKSCPSHEPQPESMNKKYQKEYFESYGAIKIEKRPCQNKKRYCIIDKVLPACVNKGEEKYATSSFQIKRHQSKVSEISSCKGLNNFHYP